MHVIWTMLRHILRIKRDVTQVQSSPRADTTYTMQLCILIYEIFHAS